MKAVPTPPSLMKSLMAGFDVVSKHFGLIFFSIALDLLLWFGPQIRLVRLLEPILREAASLPEIQGSGSIDLMLEGMTSLNLLSLLRSFPVGIPSLMASRSTLDTPLIQKPLTLEITSFWIAAGLWLLLVFAGIVFGTLFFSIIGQLSISGSLDLRYTLQKWPRHTGHVLLLSVFWLILMVILLLPMSCLLSILLLLGISSGTIPILVALFLGGFVIWFVIPLFFSPHGIFATQRPMWESILQSVRISRVTYSTTTLLILAVIVLSQGLDILWNTPPEDSWFLLVGITGHAFVTAGLLSATFIYYRDAELWLNQWAMQKESKMV